MKRQRRTKCKYFRLLLGRGANRIYYECKCPKLLLGVSSHWKGRKKFIASVSHVFKSSSPLLFRIAADALKINEVKVNGMTTEKSENLVSSFFSAQKITFLTAFMSSKVKLVSGGHEQRSKFSHVHLTIMLRQDVKWSRWNSWRRKEERSLHFWKIFYLFKLQLWMRAI